MISYIIALILLIIVFIVFKRNKHKRLTNKEHLNLPNKSSYPQSSYSLSGEYEYDRCSRKLKSCVYDKHQRLIALRKQVAFYKKKVFDLERLREPNCLSYKNNVQTLSNKIVKQNKTIQHYYSKFRELQEKVANLERNLSYLSDEKELLRQKLIYCRRYKTMNPTIIKQLNPYSLEPNSITGNGLEVHRDFR